MSKSQSFNVYTICIFYDSSTRETNLQPYKIFLHTPELSRCLNHDHHYTKPKDTKSLEVVELILTK